MDRAIRITAVIAYTVFMAWVCRRAWPLFAKDGEQVAWIAYCVVEWGVCSLMILSYGYCAKHLSESECTALKEKR